jgi:histone acetyltransferase
VTVQAILAKIKSLTRSHIVHPGLQVFKDKKPGEIKLSKDEVPGLGESVPTAPTWRVIDVLVAETGWNPDLDAM